MARKTTGHDEFEEFRLTSIGVEASDWSDFVAYLNDQDLTTGQRISHYSVIERLDEGGMGVVYSSATGLQRRRDSAK